MDDKLRLLLMLFLCSWVTPIVQTNKQYGRKTSKYRGSVYKKSTDSSRILFRRDWESPTIDVESIDKSDCTVDKQLLLKFKNKTIPCGYNASIEFFSGDGATAPNMTLSRANVNKLYTLMMIDPDAPNRTHPVSRSWVHWLVTNIGDADVTKGEIIMDYNPPSPPAGTGEHRYVFLLFKQDGRVTAGNVGPERGKFDVNKFVKKNKFESLTGMTLFTTKNPSDKDSNDNTNPQIVGSEEDNTTPTPTQGPTSQTPSQSPTSSTTQTPTEKQKGPVW